MTFKVLRANLATALLAFAIHCALPFVGTAAPCEACSPAITCAFCAKSAGDTPKVGLSKTAESIEQACFTPSHDAQWWAEVQFGISPSWSDTDKYKTQWWEQNASTCECTKKYSDETTATDGSWSYAWNWDGEAIDLQVPKTYTLKCTFTDTGDTSCCETTADDPKDMSVTITVRPVTCTCENLPNWRQSEPKTFILEDSSINPVTGETVYTMKSGYGWVESRYELLRPPYIGPCEASVTMATSESNTHSGGVKLDPKISGWFGIEFSYSYAHTDAFSFSATHPAVNGRILKIYRYSKCITAFDYYNGYYRLSPNSPWRHSGCFQEVEKSYPNDAIQKKCEAVSNADTCEPQQDGPDPW